MTARDFEGKMQDLILLAGESEITSEFTAGLQAVLNEAQKDLEFAMTADEFEAVRVRTLLIREMLVSQEKFLQRLKNEILVRMFPDEPPGEEVLN